MKKHAPATLRNREAIAEVLADELPKRGTLLEIASGSGEHAVYFAGRFPGIVWQPSDPDDDALASIAAWCADYPGANLLPPIRLDASAADWPIDVADGMFCANMAHISPWSVTEGLFAGAQRLLPVGAALILYGPYIEDGVETAPSNVVFDQGLKSRNPNWGLRRLSAMDELAVANGLERTRRYVMPANNLVLIYRRDDGDG